jgi:hypothetical protein
MTDHNLILRRAHRAERLAAVSLALAGLSLAGSLLRPAAGSGGSPSAPPAGAAVRGLSAQVAAAGINKQKAPMLISRKKTPLVVIDQVELAGRLEPRVATIGPSGGETILTSLHAAGGNGGAVVLFDAQGQLSAVLGATTGGGRLELYDPAGNLAFQAP